MGSGGFRCEVPGGSGADLVKFRKVPVQIPREVSEKIPAEAPEGSMRFQWVPVGFGGLRWVPVGSGADTL